ncbi:ankyrin repeat-containing domain protein [Gorgonomyces haynaldii]|nr:ankyrin repeat-containing domain protein [Gorgonomyces haynaldii]
MDTDEQVFSPELKQQLSILLQTQFLNRPLIDFLFQWNRKEILEAVFPQLDLPLTPAPTSTDLSSLESLFQCCDLSVIRLVLRQQPQLANQPVSSVSLLYPIHIAAMHLRLDLMQFLITECQVNVNQTDGLSKTALHHAISAITKFSRPHVSPLVLIHKLDHFTPIAYLLVESGALLNHVDHQGTFPLQLLLSGWYGQDMIDDHPWLPELVGYMVQSGANVNTPTKYNETLLHVCARQKLYLCALVLTSHGAWIRPNKTGKLPGDICRDYVQRPLFHALQTKLPSLGYLSKVALTRNKPLPPFILK